MESYQKMSLKNMINFANPRSFVASFIPSVFGLVLSIKLGFSYEVLKSISIVLSCIFLQSSVNTLNDHSDFIKGVDCINDNLEEDDNVMAYNNIDPKKVELLGYSYLVLGVIFGIFSLQNLNKFTLIIAIVGLLTVLLYSKGPMPISYLPIGEITSGFVMGGLIPLGVYSVVANNIDKNVLIYSMPLIIGISMIMMTNNGSDIEKDLKAGRLTLAVLMNRKKFAILYHISAIFWILSALTLIYYFTNIKFLILFLIILVLKKDIIIELIKVELEPKLRIRQMKNIVKANLLINSVYVILIGFSIIKV